MVKIWDNTPIEHHASKIFLSISPLFNPSSRCSPQNIQMLLNEVLALDKIMKMKKKNTITTARSTHTPSPARAAREGAGEGLLDDEESPP